MCEQHEYSHQKEKRNLDFIDILIQAKDSDGNSLTDQEIRDEVDTFMFEGHDTTASGLSWALYNLAKFPGYQKKCREEVTSVVGSKDDIEWADIAKLQYLTMFLSESMRLYPPVYFIGRKLETDLPLSSKLFKHSKVVLPKGTISSVYIFIHHRNGLVWEDPEVFNPERFSSENKAKQQPLAYIPFSAGPRNCIGQNFAMNEMKVTLGQIIRKFELYLDKETPIPVIEADLILHSLNGIFVKMRRL